MTSKEWKKYKLGEIADINMGQSPKSEYYNTLGDGIAFLQGNRTFGFKNPAFDTYTTLATKTAQAGDVIMSVRAPVGDLNITPINICIGRGLCSIRMKNNNQEFLYYLMKYCVSNLINRESGTVFGSVNRNDISSLEINVPCDDILQREIAKVLSAIDDKIELNNSINNNLEQQAQAIFKSWFVDFEPFGGTMPNDWSISTLSIVADYLNGLAMQKFRPNKNEKGIPVLKIKELKQGFCDVQSDLCSLNIKPEYLINDGDVIFSWSGTLLLDFWCSGLCGLNQHLFKVSSEKYDKWFYYFWTKHHLDTFIAIAADKATTMGHIKREDLDKSEVLIPDNKTYKQLNSILSPLINLIIKNRVENRQLTQLRDTLLPKLMSGEIDVSKVDISVDKLLFSEEKYVNE